MSLLKGGLNYRAAVELPALTAPSIDPAYCLAVGGYHSNKKYRWLDAWGLAWCDDITRFPRPGFEFLSKVGQKKGWSPTTRPQKDVREVVNSTKRLLRPQFTEWGIFELYNNIDDIFRCALYHRICGLSGENMGERFWEILAAGGFPCGYAPPDGATLEEYSPRKKKSNHVTLEERKKLPLVVFWPHDEPMKIRGQ